MISSEPVDRNFLPSQYSRDQKLSINHNYLSQQFSDYETILDKVKKVVIDGDFTLGTAVDKFESKFASMIGAKHAIGVGSGTDALFLSLKTLGIKAGDEVITTPYTFYATIGAIVTAGAKPIFVDIADNYNIDPLQIEKAISPKTKAILPVHWSGRPCDMDEITSIAKKYEIPIIEDACHAVQATYRGKCAGVLGDIGCFSFHPLKNLNVWGDAGIIVTNSDEINQQLRLMRNHGLVNRDKCIKFSYNSRLDTVQAVVADHLLEKLDHITKCRIENSRFFDTELANIKEITTPSRPSHIKEVFHLYIVQAQQRDELQKYLISHNVDAKIHYPVPMHLQPAAAEYGYKAGDFPKAEGVCNSVLSLPVHEFITPPEREKVVCLINQFYGRPMT